jgi:hypothetical protein
MAAIYAKDLIIGPQPGKEMLTDEKKINPGIHIFYLYFIFL